jgi:acyl transferase domain-containing protein
LDLRQILCRAASEVEAAEDLLIQTRITQPALFVIEYALAKLWMSWGVKPRAMIGHSVGEYVAGCLAGVFTLEEALGVVARRAQLVQAQPGGAMLAVRLPEKEALPLLPEHLSLAAVNSPSLCVVSGPYNAIEKLEAQLKSKGIAGRRLETSHAFHSAMMDPVVDPLTKLLENVSLKEPSIPYISNVTGHWITASEALNPKYWASHMRQTVRFADGVSELLKNPEIILLEVGPGQTLTALASQHPARAAGQIVLPSLSSSKGQEISAVLTALGRLWLAGNPVDWFGFYTHEKRRRVPLPTYPFERKRFWAEPATQAATHATEGERTANATAVPSIGLSASADPSSARIPAADTLTSRKVPMATSGHHAPTATPSRKERILMMLTTLFQELSGMNGEDITPTAAFWEIGFDSLFLAQASLAIEKQFGARIDFRQMLKNQSTLNDLANYLNDKLPAEALAITPVAAARRTTDSANFSTGAVPPHPRSHSRAIAGIDESDRIVATTGQNKPQQITSLSPASVAKPVPRHETVARPPFRQSAQNTKERKPELIRLQAGDSGQEFIFILDNRSFDLLKLANFYLGEDLPLYASMVPIPEQTLRAASQRQFSSLPKVEDLAAEHTDLIMHQERTGPLLLAGHCFGGVLAFEVAHQLQRAGQQVQAVLMLDTWMTQPTSWWRRKTWLRAHSRRLLQRGPLYLWRKSLRWANLKREELALKHDLVVKDDFGAPVPWATVLRIYRHAVADYEPQVLPSRGILFVSKDDWLSNAYRRLDDSLGTAQWFKDGVEVVEVPGDHVTVLDEPHLPELAQCYKICLEKLRSKQISS